MTRERQAKWAEVRVSDVVDAIDYGYTAKAIQGTGPRLLRITDIQHGSVDWTRVPTCEITGEDLRRYQLAPGDIVFARTGATTGKSYLIANCPSRSVFASYLIRLRPTPTLLPAYMAFFFQSNGYWRQIAEQATGTAQPGVNSTRLRDLRLPLAPRPEQHRIVGVLESFFTRLDDAVSTLERVQRNLKRYRASVLKAAVEGRLVPTEAELARAEGRTYEPASVLLERILVERRRRWEEVELAKLTVKGKMPKDNTWKAKYVEPVAPDTSDLPELPDGWCWASIDQLSHLVRNGYSTKPKSAGDVRILRISAVRPMSVDFTDSRWLSGDPDKYARDLVQAGDLLFTRYNGSPSLVGVSGLVRVVERPTVHPDKLIKVRFVGAGLNLTYLELATNTAASRRFIEGRTRTTAGQAGISGSDIKQVPIPLPPSAEQARVAIEAGRHLSLIDASVAALNANKARCARLRQSILKWAFEGRLADQDPTDEPASALLERIKAERLSERGAQQSASVDGKKPKSPGHRKARTSNA